jgi:hypothetical protein
MVGCRSPEIDKGLVCGVLFFLEDINWNKFRLTLGHCFRSESKSRELIGVLQGEIKVIWERIFSNLPIHIKEQVGSRGYTAIVNQDVHFKTGNLAQILTIVNFLARLNRTKIYVGALRESSSFIRPVGYADQLIREEYKQASEDSSPSSGWLPSEYAQQILPQLDKFGAYAAFLLGWTFDSFAIIFLVGGLRGRGWHFFVASTAMFVAGWYLSGVFFFVTHG